MADLKQQLDEANTLLESYRDTPLWQQLLIVEAELAAMKADNARYKAALERIAESDLSWPGPQTVRAQFQDIARTALTASDEQATLVTGEKDE